MEDRLRVVGLEWVWSGFGVGLEWAESRLRVGSE